MLPNFWKILKINPSKHRVFELERSAAEAVAYNYICCAVHTLVCSYAGVSGDPVLPHTVPPQPLHIYSIKSLPLHIFSVQSLTEKAVTDFSQLSFSACK